MLFKSFLAVAVVVVLPELSFASPLIESNTLPVYKNANRVFNCLHSSMRQWGSSLNHNGMSFFPAYIPAGTELYHGTGTRRAVQVMEWLAFEPEHASNFAWIFPDSPPSAYDPEDQQAMSIKWLLDTNLTRMLMHKVLESEQDDFNSPQHLSHDSGRQPILKIQPPLEEPIDRRSGWLHTYVMKHDLRVVYLDGQSAAKTRIGTLDLQDFILDRDSPLRDPQRDRPRALRMCRIASEWKIDGFVRMEHGFELILCDFKTNADLILVERVNTTFDTFDNSTVFFYSFMKAITSRYHSIGMNRVLLDYSRMVTAFTYDVELFYNQSELPRLNNISDEDAATILADLSKSVMHSNKQPVSQWTNWQAVADMIIARYSDALHELAYSPFYNSKKRIDQQINMLMRPFIDYDHRSTPLEIQRCASHFIPRNSTFSTASAAITHVSEKICLTFFNAAELPSLEDAKRSFQSLVSYLAWTTWKDCRGCQYNEVCVTAIWPFGNTVDHTHPSCRNGTQLRGRWDYWREDHPPPP